MDILCWYAQCVFGQHIYVLSIFYVYAFCIILACMYFACMLHILYLYMTMMYDLFYNACSFMSVDISWFPGQRFFEKITSSGLGLMFGLLQSSTLQSMSLPLHVMKFSTTSHKGEEEKQRGSVPGMGYPAVTWGYW